MTEPIRSPAPPRARLSAAPTLLVLAGCGGRQSALAAAGPEAAAVAELFAVMAIAGTVIWFVVVLAYLHARRTRREVWSEAAASRLILWGGAVFPAATLLALLTYALWLMPALRPWAAVAPPDLRVEVVGHQYWWEVTYRPGGPDAVVAANEVRLPAGRRVEVALVSRDVIHSFWIPPLAGKMDLIPGRTNRLTLAAERPGSYRGACAEYCGTSHALMAFTVEAMDPAAFDTWLAAQAAPAAAEGRGLEIFLASGCGACHTVRGTEAEGRIGPDLTHLGSRPTIAAGILPREPETIASFVAAPELVKPGGTMPGFAMLSPEELATLAAWLDGLR
jgi:cytochrome c oxidase subunit 2